MSNRFDFRFFITFTLHHVRMRSSAKLSTCGCGDYPSVIMKSVASTKANEFGILTRAVSSPMVGSFSRETVNPTGKESWDIHVDDVDT